MKSSTKEALCSPVEGWYSGSKQQNCQEIEMRLPERFQFASETGTSALYNAESHSAPAIASQPPIPPCAFPKKLILFTEPCSKLFNPNNLYILSID